jgi:hypothetical protein
MPPFWPSTCACAASRNGIRRPIGRMNLPSRKSSANSRTLDGSGFAHTRVIFTVGFCAAALSGSTAVYPREPFCLTFAISFAAPHRLRCQQVHPPGAISQSSCRHQSRGRQRHRGRGPRPALSRAHLQPLARLSSLPYALPRAQRCPGLLLPEQSVPFLHVCRKAHKLVSCESNQRDRRRVRQVHAIRQMGHVRIVHCHQLGIGRVG